MVLISSKNICFIVSILTLKIHQPLQKPACRQAGVANKLKKGGTGNEFVF